MKRIDAFLNGITMYKLVLYGLGLLAVLALLFGLVGTIPYDVGSLLTSLAILVPLSYLSDYAFARMTRTDLNPESAVITALILFFVLAPAATVTDGLWVALAAFVSIGSKYVIRYQRKHVFNPAAFGILVLTLLGSGMGLWWVGTPALFPATALLGFLIVRKLRRFDLWASFFAAAFLVKFGYEFLHQGSVLSGLFGWFVSWPLIFFSTVMLTEPLTMPSSRNLRNVYGIFVGVLFSLPYALGPLYPTGQLALILGNVFSFFVSPKGRLRLTLKSVEPLSSTLVEFAFMPDRRIAYRAGQYAEWTLGHARADSRGVRRYFTLSSAPDDRLVRVGVRTAANMSTFKRHLLSLKEGDSISLSNLAGDFVLPQDGRQKLLFIAGGVGVTPFASMIRSLVAKHEARDIVLLYLASNEHEFGYRELLEQARDVGVTTLPIAGAILTADDVIRFVPDSRERIAYISGPQVMVTHYKSVMQELDVPKIRTDYFPGL